MGGGQVEVRWLEIDRIGSADWRRLESVLDGTERAQAARFRRDEDRRASIAAHGLTRLVLSEWAPVPPEAWRFAAAAGGKPRIAQPMAGSPLFFNLSHTARLVAVAVTSAGEVGLDIEATADDRLNAAVADDLFSPAEAEWLAGRPMAERGEAFAGLWTLKEAIVKALGGGLAQTLAAFTVTLDPPAVSGLSGPWLLRRFRPMPGHVGALALRCPDDGRVAVSMGPA